MKFIQKFSIAIVGFTLLFGMTITPASSITHGVLDGQAHPYVGLMVFDVNGSPAWRCTGTLVNPTTMLTAGHCTYGTSSGRVWFNSNDQAAILASGYPSTGGIEFTNIQTHPDFNPNAFYLHDMGLVTLAQPVYVSTYGQLPSLGYFTQLLATPAYHHQDFTPVGYGLQWANSGINTVAHLIRYQATVNVITGDAIFSPGSSDSILFTNNAATGGTCFGDSGGPIFIAGTNVIAAITSFGMNSECGGTGGGYRMDVPSSQNFFNAYVGA